MFQQISMYNVFLTEQYINTDKNFGAHNVYNVYSKTKRN